MRLSILAATLLIASSTTILASADEQQFDSTGALGPVSPEPTPTAVPPLVAGELFVYYKNARAVFPFTQLAAAAGLSHNAGYALPADLATYECVVLPVTQSFSAADTDALVTYVRAGGNLIAIGEWSGYHGTSNGAMNGLAEAVGSDLRIQTGAKDLGFHDTTNVPLTTLTLGVDKFRYAAYSPIVGTDPILAPALALGTDGTTAILASQQAGLGVFTLMADINAFSDYNGNAFTQADNGDLGSALCNGLVALGVPVL